MIGLTNFIESITINVIGAFNAGRNQFDLVNPSEIDLVKEVAGKLSIVISSYNIYRRTGDSLKLISRNDPVEKKDSIVFIHKDIVIASKSRLEQLVKEASLERAGISGRFPYILPSRDKTFR